MAPALPTVDPRGVAEAAWAPSLKDFALQWPKFHSFAIELLCRTAHSQNRQKEGTPELLVSDLWEKCALLD